MAKTRRTFLGSRSQEEERPKLVLRVIHLFSVVGVVVQMLPAVTVIWWWTCGFVEFCVGPTANTVDLQDPSREATVQWNETHIQDQDSVHAHNNNVQISVR